MSPKNEMLGFVLRQSDLSNPGALCKFWGMRNHNRPGAVLNRSCFLSLLIMSSSLMAAPDPTTATLERSAIEEKYKWDLSKMYAGQEEWDAHYKKVESMIGEFAAKTGKIGDSSASLLEALKLRDQINIQ